MVILLIICIPLSANLFASLINSCSPSSIHMPRRICFSLFVILWSWGCVWLIGQITPCPVRASNRGIREWYYCFIYMDGLWPYCQCLCPHVLIAYAVKTATAHPHISMLTVHMHLHVFIPFLYRLPSRLSVYTLLCILPSSFMCLFLFYAFCRCSSYAYFPSVHTVIGFPFMPIRLVCPLLYGGWSDVDCFGVIKIF